jgi:hypothetical protein
MNKTMPIEYEEIIKILESRNKNVSECILKVLNDLRPCVRLKTERANNTPIHGTLISRMFGKSPPHPLLDVLCSKYGGMPYYENDIEIKNCTFIGQINFAEVTAHLTAGGHPIPVGMPRHGLLAVDEIGDCMNARTRWYDNPKKIDLRYININQKARYETKIHFTHGLSLRGLDYFDCIPKDDGELWDLMNDLEIKGIDEDEHILFGHTWSTLNEHYGFTPKVGRSNNIKDYQMIWRISWDNQSGMGFGTNWYYVIIHKQDLEHGQFENSIVTAANA